jgi:hypothetical protein
MTSMDSPAYDRLKSGIIGNSAMPASFLGCIGPGV